MIRCLVASELLNGSVGTLPQATSHHVRNVLRVRQGTPIRLMDGAGSQRDAVITAVERGAVGFETCGSVETLPRPACEIILFQCIAKANRMELVVEKAVELGATKVVPVISRNVVVKMREGMRVERWERMANSALEQCGGYWRTEISPVTSWRAAVKEIAALSPAFVAALHPEARPVREVLGEFCGGRPACAAWVVGPEGDFAEHELAEVTAAGALPVSLGNTVLRTDTAGVYGLCVLSAAFCG